jgi:hypothetical protein
METNSKQNGNEKAHPMIRVLRQLGVDFEAKKHRHYKFRSAEGLMDLSVETWPQDDGMHLSVAHYGEQNGDLMADPEMEFFVGGGQIAPISYRNDYLGLFQKARFVDERSREMIRPGLAHQLFLFSGQWAQRIQSAGYLPCTQMLKNVYNHGGVGEC